MKLILIAAIGPHRVIGRNGKLPWHIPEDLARFKQLTTGHTVLMGRKTFRSLGKTLPHRRIVVLTTRLIEGVETYSSLRLALNALQGEECVFVAGGGNVYEQTLSLADELFLTMVSAAERGDTYFPEYEEYLQDHCRLAEEEQHKGFIFRHYVRNQ
jgi:dihydrofolate reductase